MRTHIHTNGHAYKAKKYYMALLHHNIELASTGHATHMCLNESGQTMNFLECQIQERRANRTFS